MAKTEKKVQKKQEVTNRPFNIGNIASASKNSNLKKDDAVSKQNLVPIKFKVHKNLIERFHLLRMGYAKKQKNFALSNNEMFSIMVLFMYSHYKENKFLQDCPEDFKEAIIRPGKRKATSRTVAFPDSDSILFTIEEQIADKYMDIMFSYIVKDENDSIYNTHHSRTYFFYDFMDFIDLNKTEMFNFTTD